MVIIGLVHLTKLFNQDKTFSEFFVIDVSAESQWLCFQRKEHKELVSDLLISVVHICKKSK